MDQENKCLLEEGATPPSEKPHTNKNIKITLNKNIFFFMVQAEGKCTVKSGAVNILFT